MYLRNGRLLLRTSTVRSCFCCHGGILLSNFSSIDSWSKDRRYPFFPRSARKSAICCQHTHDQLELTRLRKSFGAPRTRMETSIRERPELHNLISSWGKSPKGV